MNKELIKKVVDKIVSTVESVEGWKVAHKYQDTIDVNTVELDFRFRNDVRYKMFGLNVGWDCQIKYLGTRIKIITEGWDANNLNFQDYYYINKSGRGWLKFTRHLKWFVKDKTKVYDKNAVRA